MKNKKRKIKNPCVVCGNEVDKSKEFETLLGGVKGMKHYDCK